jgi:hypothetical protein
VITVPPDAKVLLNGQQAGETPYENAKIVAGTYSLQLDLADYESQKGNVTIQRNETKEINTRLQYLYGKLKVTSKPSGAKVFVNEEATGTTPFSSARIQPGNCMLRINLPGYQDVTENLMVVRDQSLEKSYELVHTKAYLDSVAAYKEYKHRKARWTRRITFGVLGAATFGAGAIFDAIAQNHIVKMNNIQANYRSATTGFSTYKSPWQEQKDKAEKNILIRNICYGVAGGFGVAFLISLPF